MNEKILLVDDDELVRSGLAANLQRVGFEVYTASCTRQAKAHLATVPIDLALCDLMLGDENGLEVLQYLQASHPEVSVIIITGHGSVRTALDALRGGASDYIQKPADPDEVIHRIHTVLDSANLRRALVAERQKAEERKRIIHDQLNRAERMSSLGVLAEGAARDLKEILQPVETLPGDLRKKLDPLHEGHGPLISLDDALRKASAIIRDLEGIGRSTPVKKAVLQINELVASYLQSADYRHLFGLNPMVKLETQFEEGLPPVSGSAHHLRQMVANFVTQTMESMTTGGVLRIHTSVEHLDPGGTHTGPRKAGDYIVLRFEDTAAQFTDEDRERLFEPFYVRNHLGRRLLSGLGLTLAYRVIEDHDGFVELSPSGQVTGNRIEVYLPVGQADDTEILELRPDYTGRERLLLVDDSETQRADASAMMKELGYEVTAVASGQAAIQVLRDKIAEQPDRPPFDLLIIDLILGDAFDGVETFKAALDLQPGQKAILASGFADIARIVEARKLGIACTFQKPYTLEALGKNIRTALDEG